MKIWHNDQGEAFRNSETCWGESFTTDSDIVDVARIVIRGEYPEHGWSYNEEAHEMVVVTVGSGSVEIKDGKTHTLTAGDVVYLAPQERFRWSGDMELVISCSPAFDASKYHVEDN